MVLLGGGHSGGNRHRAERDVVWWRSFNSLRHLLCDNKVARAKHKLPDDAETYFASYFSWCGHVAVTDTTRGTSGLYMHKNMEWLRKMRKEVGSQYHGRRSRVWRREQAVAQCAGTEWTKVARDRTAWHSQIHEMKKWRKQEMADHSVIGFE